MLPAQLNHQLETFRQFLQSKKLNSVTIKNYVSDIRHFLSWLSQTKNELNQSSLENYLSDIKSSNLPQNTLNRYTASINRFANFLNLNTTSKISSPVSNHLPETDNLLEKFKKFLTDDKKSHSTIKNYISDINHFLNWTANNLPHNQQNLSNILIPNTLSDYRKYLNIYQTTNSIISRRESSIRKLAQFAKQSNLTKENLLKRTFSLPQIPPLYWIKGNHNISKENNSPHPLQKFHQKLESFSLYRRYHELPFTPYLHLAILVLVTTALGIFSWNQIIKDAKPSSADFPPTSLKRPTRQLSFQGRLTDSSDTPLTDPITMIFKLFNEEGTGTPPTGGTELYSATCTVDPDQDGIFNTLIGDTTCGSEIDPDVFTDNQGVWLQVGIGSSAQTLSPRQPIATVAYALNSETLQGYPASDPAINNSVPVFNNSGNLMIGITSPTIESTTGTFYIKGQALEIQTSTDSGGDIILRPDSVNAVTKGQVMVIGGTTTDDLFRVTNADLTTGSLISGYVGNGTTGGYLLSLSSDYGGTENNKFAVTTTGKVGIGRTNPLYSLHIPSGGLLVDRIGIGSTSSTYELNITGSGYFSSTLNIGSGLTSPHATITGNLSVGGTPTFSGVNTGTGTTALFVSSTGVVTKRVLGALAFQDTAVGTTYNASNGITLSSNIFKLGGTLTENTSIGTSSFGLNFTGLGNTPSLSIASNGNIGIGVTNASYLLQLQGGISNNNYLASFYNTGTSASAGGIYVRTDGNGNLLTLNASGTDIVTISPTGATFNTPTSFNSSGDVSLAYNLIFTNATASYIRSAAPLFIESGESYASSDLTLKTYNSGSLVFDTPGGIVLNQAQSWDLIDSTTAALNIEGSLLSFDTSNSRIGIGTTNPTTKLDVNGTVKMTGFNMGTGATASYVLTTDASGNGSWTDISSTAGPWTLTGSNLYPDSNSYNVAIGHTTPSTKLDVGGHVFIGTGSTFNNSAGWARVVDIYGDPHSRITSRTSTIGLDITTHNSGYYGSPIGAHIYTSTNHPLSFGTNAGVRMTILAGGNVGIGTTNPLYKLHIPSGGLLADRIGIGSTSSVYTLNIDSNARIGGTALITTLGVGATSSSYALNVSSNANVGTFLNVGSGLTSPHATITGNLSVGGTPTFSGVNTGTGTTALFVDASGVVTKSSR